MIFSCAGSLIPILLGSDIDNVFHISHMSYFIPVLPLKFHSSHGTVVLDHLATDGASLAGGQVTVVAVGQVNADFLGSLHLETVHSLTSLRDIQLVVIRVAHCNSLLFRFPESKPLSGWRVTFSFRTPSLPSVEKCMNVNWRKEWYNLQREQQILENDPFSC